MATRDDSTFGQVVLVEIDLAARDRPGDGAATGVPASTATATAATAAPVDPAVTTTGTPAGSGPRAPDAVAICRAMSPRADGSGWLDATDSSGLGAALSGMMGHAAAWGDVDGDGTLDLFAGTFADRPLPDYQVRGAIGPSPDRLLLGAAEAAGITVAEAATPFTPGRTSGAVFADLDLDGDVDLVVARNVSDGQGASAPAPTELWRNDDG